MLKKKHQCGWKIEFCTLWGTLSQPQIFLVKLSRLEGSKGKSFKNLLANWIRASNSASPKAELADDSNRQSWTTTTNNHNPRSIHQINDYKKCCYDKMTKSGAPGRARRGFTCDALGVPMSRPDGHLCSRGCRDRRQREDTGEGSDRKEDRGGAPHRPHPRHGRHPQQPTRWRDSTSRWWEARQERDAQKLLEERNDQRRVEEKIEMVWETGVCVCVTIIN